MPKFLPPDEVEALKERGVVFPGEAPPIPSETVVRALGDIGLPHSEKVERMEVDEPDTGGEAIGSFENIDNVALVESYLAAQDYTAIIMTSAMGEAMPGNMNADLISQLEKLQPAFEVFQSYHLQPEVVLTPAYRNLDFWENLYNEVKDGPLNPIKSNPINPAYTRKVLRNSIFIADSIKDNWDKMTNPAYQSPSWQLSVSSGLVEPSLNNITTYGYYDKYNIYSSKELNMLLQKLGALTVRDRISGIGGVDRLNIHPTIDAYLMHQLTRIVRADEPLDSVTSISWLSGSYFDKAPIGTWNPDLGEIELEMESSDTIDSHIGIRPSVRADHA